MPSAGPPDGDPITLARLFARMAGSLDRSECATGYSRSPEARLDAITTSPAAPCSTIPAAGTPSFGPRGWGGAQAGSCPMGSSIGRTRVAKATKNAETKNRPNGTGDGQIDVGDGITSARARFGRSTADWPPGQAEIATMMPSITMFTNRELLPRDTNGNGTPLVGRPAVPARLMSPKAARCADAVTASIVSTGVRARTAAAMPMTTRTYSAVEIASNPIAPS